MPELRVRPMEAADLPAAAAAAAAAFDVEVTDAGLARRWQERVAHALVTDPDGAFVAERDGHVVGAAEAIRRERLWCLSLLAVRPGLQSAGAGRALLQKTLDYADGAEAALVVSSNDPRALRLYGRAGFSLRPTFDAAGTVDRRALPPPDRRVREGDRKDLEALEPVSRDVRGARHTPELELALRRGGRLFVIADRGFAVAQPGEGVWLLVARDEEVAGVLLWHALAEAGDTAVAVRAPVRWITAGQDWAIDVVLLAGLSLSARGALAVRGEPGPLHPFLPSPPFA